jgi:hypothetical protein
VRDREENEEKDIGVEEFKSALREEVEEKKLEPDFLQ